MSTKGFSILPEELISLVAIHGDAQTALKLSQTCRRARSACHTAVVFEKILERSQIQNWKSDSLNMVALSVRVGRDVSAWMHYAIADHQSWVSQHELPSRMFQSFETDLILLNHPSLYQKDWASALENLVTFTETEVYCLALVILAKERPLPQLGRVIPGDQLDLLLNDETSDGFVWALTISVWIIKEHLHGRRDNWHYSYAGLVPYISLPRPTELTEAMHHYPMPLPCVRDRTTEQQMDRWRPNELASDLSSWSDIVDGQWNGYYTHFGNGVVVDPPMMDITFESCPEEQDCLLNEYRVRAQNCYDGIGRFELRGKLVHGQHSSIEFHGFKNYDSWGFTWKLKFLSRNLAVGFWGQEGEDRSMNCGLVCLWKVGG